MEGIMRMEKVTRGTEHNNYSALFEKTYNAQTKHNELDENNVVGIQTFNHDFPIIYYVIKRIDLITFINISCCNKYPKIFESKGYKIISDEIISKGKLHRIVLSKDRSEIRLFHRLMSHPYHKDFIAISDVTRTAYHEVMSILCEHNESPRLGKTEIAFDFYCADENIFSLKEMLEQSLYLRFARHTTRRFVPNKKARERSQKKGILSTDDTFYSGGRGSSKSTKIYIKRDKYSVKFVRCELTLLRKYFARNKTPLSLTSIIGLPFDKIFSFMTLECDKLIKYEFKKAAKETPCNTRNPSRTYQLIKQTILSYYNQSDRCDKFALMDVVTMMRKWEVGGYGRFLVPMVGLKEKIEQAHFDI
jgi:hypothetical protein